MTSGVVGTKNFCDNLPPLFLRPECARMSTPLLYNVLFAWKCSSTHHKLALDALRHLQSPTANQWMNLFLSHIETYLDGAKAPDNKFKDFKNHVLHVHENYWGGAVTSTQKWYELTKTALAAKKWAEVVYNAGVLSHYYSDPWQPFHTGQSEQEGIVHRAAEWSIACAYQELQAILEEGDGYPTVTIPDSEDWLGDMVRHAANTAHEHYQASIDHYDLKKGTKDPPAGLDDELRRRIAPLLGSAVVGFARILDRAIAETGAQPPKTNITLLGVMAKLTVPIFFVTKKMKDAKEKATVLAMYNEFQQTGKVLATLPEDDDAIRALHAEEVSKIPLEQLDAEIPPPPGQKHVSKTPTPAKSLVASPPSVEPSVKLLSQPTAKEALEEPPRPLNTNQKFYLDRTAPVEKAPSIGPKTASQLERIGVKTVAHLLDQPADAIAARLKQKHLDATTIRAWQQQARLVCEVPRLRGHDAQLLVACSIGSREELAVSNLTDLYRAVDAFAQSPSGQRILRDSAAPDLNEVQEWITAAQSVSAAAA
jgi:hypothetical protein